jgi:hypothetical protein
MWSHDWHQGHGIHTICGTTTGVSSNAPICLLLLIKHMVLHNTFGGTYFGGSSTPCLQ